MSTTRWARALLVCAAVAAILLIGAQAEAQVVSWIDPGGGDYRDGDNWDGGGIPGTGNHAYFGQDATYTVTFSQNEMNNFATVRYGEVTFDLNTHTYSLLYAHEPPPSLTLGDAADTDMKLTILDGRLNLSWARMATASGSGATLEIGQGGSVGNAKTLYVGYQGEAELRIIDGGKLLKQVNTSTGAMLGYYAGSLGIVTVQGVGSEWQAAGTVTVGEFGTGIASITDGATATVYGASVRVGAYTGSNGTMTIGGGSSLTLAARPSSSVGPGNVDVGAMGTGVLIVSGGASLTGGESLVIGGYDDGAGGRGDGKVTITGNGSTLSTSSNGVRIGEYGDAVLDILDGATASHEGGGYMAYGPGSTGKVTVSGPGSTWAITGFYSALYMGRDYSGNAGGRAELTVTNGGRVEIEDLMLGPDAVVTTDVLTIGTPPALALGVAKALAMVAEPEGLFVKTLTLADGAQVDAGSLHLSADGQIYGIGGITGDVLNDGVIGPGDTFNPFGSATAAIGTLVVTGNYDQAPGSVLQIDLTAAPPCDLLQATGMAQLDGLLELRLFGAYAPMQGDSFTVLTAAGGVDGQFADVTCAALDGTDLFADIIYSDTAVVVRILPEPASSCLLLLGAVGLLPRRMRRRRP